MEGVEYGEGVAAGVGVGGVGWGWCQEFKVIIPTDSSESSRLDLVSHLTRQV